MIRLVAGGLIAIACVLIGMAIRRHFNLRRDAYATICDFAAFLTGEISYLKTTVPVAIGEFVKGRKGSVAVALNQYAEALRLGTAENFVPDVSGFKDGEKKEFARFLKSIGTKPLGETLSEIKRYSLAFEELKAKSDNDAKKLGSMYFKLLVLVGLAVMLILA